MGGLVFLFSMGCAAAVVFWCWVGMCFICFWVGWAGDGEIHLLFERIDAGDDDFELVADAEGASGGATADLAAGGLCDEEVAFDGGDVDEAVEEAIGELDEEAVVADFDDSGMEGGSGAALELEAEEFELFEAAGFSFGFEGEALGG